MQGLSAERVRVVLFLSLVLWGAIYLWPRSVASPLHCRCPTAVTTKAEPSAVVDSHNRHSSALLASSAENFSIHAPGQFPTKFSAKNWTLRVACQPVPVAHRESAGAQHFASRSNSALRGPARLLFSLPIDLRYADAETLMVLPGIGAVRARAILALREEGRLNSVSDLLLVKGIGPKTLRGIAPQVAIDYADSCVSAGDETKCVPSAMDEVAASHE